MTTLLTNYELQAMLSKESSVPCGACRACCKQDAIPLSEKDDPAKYKWHIENGVKTLDRKANGECIYLAANGCSIHSAPPGICRKFDCRVLFLITPKAQRRIRISQNQTMQEVYGAGKRRLDTLARQEKE